MRLLNIHGITPRGKYNSYKGEQNETCKNLLLTKVVDEEKHKTTYERDFSTTACNQKWTTDVSQFNLPWGKCYLSPILDMNTNEIISYDLALSPNLEQIKRMLDGAFKKFPRVDGLIFHSDQGWQYQHQYFRKRLEKHHIIQSMSRKGNCYDNCIMETFFGRLKNEMFYGHEKEYTSFELFSKAMDEYIRYYNNERIQAKTNWMPPVKYRKASSSCA